MKFIKSKYSFFISNSYDLYFGFLLIIVGYLILIFFSNFEITSDGLIRYNALLNLFDNGVIDPIKYSYLGPVFSAPLYYLGFDVKYYNVSIFTITLFFSALAMKGYFSDEFIIKFILLMIVGSLFTGHTRDFFGEVFSASFLFLGFLLLVLKKMHITSIILISLAVANSPVLLIPLLGVVLFLVLKNKKIIYFIYLIIPVLLIFLENYIKFNGFSNQGYSSDHGIKTIMPYSGMPGFSYPILFGILSILFSFGKGLIFFTPAVFIMVKEKSIFFKNMYILLSIMALLLVLIYAKWWAWYGGITWGPRFFIFLSFLNAFVLAYFLSNSKIKLTYTRTLFIILALLLTLWVGFNGHIFDHTWFSICHRDNYSLEALHWYSPEFSVLWFPFVFTEFHLDRYNQYLLFYYLLVFIYLVRKVFYVLVSSVLTRVKEF